MNNTKHATTTGKILAWITITLTTTIVISLGILALTTIWRAIL